MNQEHHIKTVTGRKQCSEKRGGKKERKILGYTSKMGISSHLLTDPLSLFRMVGRLHNHREI